MSISDAGTVASMANQAMGGASLLGPAGIGLGVGMKLLGGKGGKTVPFTPTFRGGPGNYEFQSVPNGTWSHIGDNTTGQLTGKALYPGMNGGIPTSGTSPLGNMGGMQYAPTPAQGASKVSQLGSGIPSGPNMTAFNYNSGFNNAFNNYKAGQPAAPGPAYNNAGQAPAYLSPQQAQQAAALLRKP